MKLFVWHGDGVLDGGFTTGQITALGATLEEALKAIDNAVGEATGSFPQNYPTEIIDLGDCPGVRPRAWVTWGDG